MDKSTISPPLKRFMEQDPAFDEMQF